MVPDEGLKLDVAAGHLLGEPVVARVLLALFQQILGDAVGRAAAACGHLVQRSAIDPIFVNRVPTHPKMIFSLSRLRNIGI